MASMLERTVAEIQQECHDVLSPRQLHCIRQALATYAMAACWDSQVREEAAKICDGETEVRKKIFKKS